jgi:iron complex outermembrane recepter protein
MHGHLQMSASHEGGRTRDLRAAKSAIYGPLRGYEIVDLSAGMENERWSIEIFARNLFDTRGALGSGIQCNELVCGDELGRTAIGPKIYTYVTRPRTLGIRAGIRFQAKPTIQRKNSLANSFLICSNIFVCRGTAGPAVPAKGHR